MDTDARVEVLKNAIKDAEWRVGSYICTGGSADDTYVVEQKAKINGWYKEIGELRGLEIVPLG